jgi:outer membrane receptor for ferrienterochelin and colicin
MKHWRVLFRIVFLAAAAAAFAGNTGKVTGRVTDQSSGEPLVGVNVMIEGTVLGAATDDEGDYIILNVPPGSYALRANMMGYRVMRFENVVVSVDLTTTQNFSLDPTVVETGETVTVIAERPVVVKDLTATTAVIGADQIAALPVAEVSDAVELQAGLVKDAGGGLHVRGGRSGEVSFWIDGVPVTDVYDGGAVVEVNKNMVQELQVISGAFNAEYGQAMSGIVNITTKEEFNRFSGSATGYSGDYASGHKNPFLHIDKINPVSIRNLEASIQTPVIRDKLFLSLTGRTFSSEGWMQGTRVYNPGAVVAFGTFPAGQQDWLNRFAPEYAQSGNVLGDGSRELAYIIGSNASIDSLVVRANMPPAAAADPDSFQAYYEKLRKANPSGRGDGEAVPMNRTAKTYAQGKLVWRFTPYMKLNYHYILDDVRYQDFDRNYLLNPGGNLSRFRTGQTHLLQWTHTLSARTFYNFGVSYFMKSYKHHTYEGETDSRTVHPDLGLQQPYSFKTGGTNNSRFKRQTQTLLAKMDLTSQVSRAHQIKAGLEFRKHEVHQRDLELRPGQTETSPNFLYYGPYIHPRILPDSTIYASVYTHRPTEFSAYLQDKIELRDMIVNIGLRMDYFEPDGVVLSDPSDPSIYNPIRPENRYKDWGTDGLPGTFDADGTEGNHYRDAGEPAVTLAERRAYWTRRASSKIQVSPRLGVSFPVSDRGVIHFSYGHFFQVPRFERLYQNPDFELGSGTGNVGVIGNADLEPEQTVSGEIGLQQQIGSDIGLDVTGYFRDIRNLAGTRADEILLFGGAAKYSKFVNSDFGFVRGVIVALHKRFSGGLSASLDYTLQVAKGSNSDPEQARNAIIGGSLPEVQLTPLSWDQKHTVNASVSYAARTWGSSIIAQWGSGLPYTPRSSQDIATLLTNSQYKPTTFNADLHAYKNIPLGRGMMTVFLRIFNLFDSLNEINVYSDTGRAGVTMDEDKARLSNPSEIINSLNQWFIDPTFYAEPRRIEIGLTVSI